MEKLLLKKRALVLHVLGILLASSISMMGQGNSTSRTIAGNTITFTFNCNGEDCQTGRFVNGEPWVAAVTTSGTPVDAVTITAISPNGEIHAAESNPSDPYSHGVLTGWSSYTPSKNVMTKLPYNAQPGESIVKMVAKDPSSGCFCPNAKTRGCAAVYDVLTVLSSAPPDNGATIFRPPYAGTDKPLRSISNVHMERLPQISLLSGANLSSVVSRWNSNHYELCHMLGDQDGGEMMRGAIPVDLFGTDYGADVADEYLTDLISVFGTETYEQKKAAVYALMQHGFDNYAIYKQDISFGSGAGQHLGKKPPIVFAAAMYDDPFLLADIRAAASRPNPNELFPEIWFQEDDQIYTVPGHSSTPVWGNRDDGTAASGDESWYWWTLYQRILQGVEVKRTLGDPYGYIDGPGGGALNASYQWCCSSGPFASFAFAMHLMPWMAYANNDPEIIEYVDRVWNGRGFDGFDGGWWGKPDPCAPPPANESPDCRPHQGGAGCLYYGVTWGPDPNNPGECIHHNGDPLTDGRYSSLHDYDFLPSTWSRLSEYTLNYWDTFRDCADPTHPSYPCSGLGEAAPNDDSEPPTIPTGLASSNISETSFTLTWNASTDNIGVTGYNIYKDGQLETSVAGTSVGITSLSPGTTFSMTVCAKDAGGNLSAPSSALNVTTSGTQDTDPPSIPAGLSASAISQNGFVLSWNASTDNVGVTGYDVYKDGNFETEVTGTSANISGLLSETTYNMTVVAKDGAGNESSASSSLPVTTLSMSTILSTSSWQTFTNSVQTDIFTVHYDAVPNNNNMDGIVGIVNGTATNFSSLACIIRFNSGGQLDARNGSIYTSSASVNYSAGTNYHFRLEIDIPSHTYSVYVTPQGQSEITLASDFAFRTEQSGVTSLDGWALMAGTGSHTVSNMTFNATGGETYTVSVTGDTKDQAIFSDGTAGEWDGQLTARVGGVISGRDRVFVIPFELPDLAQDEEISGAEFSAVLSSLIGNVSGNIDIYAIDYRSSASVLTPDDYYQGAYGGDSNPIQDDFVTLSTSLGTIVSNSSASDNLVTFLNNQYAAGAQGGDYIFIRLNPDIADAADYSGYVFHTANAAEQTNRPQLELEILSGGSSTINVTGVTLSATILNLETGGNATLTETVEPSNATDPSVTWSSGDTSIATVDANGLVTAVSAGSTIITVTTNNVGFTDNCTVTVTDPVKSVISVSVFPTTLSLDEGQTADLTETVLPVDATDPSVTWSSGDTSIATVDANGLVTAVSEGSTIITVTTNNVGFTDNCSLTVSIPSEPHTVNIVGDPDDQAIHSDGTAGEWDGQPTARVGGVIAGRDRILVIPFELPTLGQDEIVLSAEFTAVLYRLVGSVSGNIDLYAIDYRSSSSVLTPDDYYQGAYGGDANPVQDDFATLSSSPGAIVSNSTASDNLATFINNQYAAGAEGGDFIFIRLNPDIADANDYSGYEFYTANAPTASNRPVLELEIGDDPDKTQLIVKNSIGTKETIKPTVKIAPSPVIDNIINVYINGYTENTRLTMTITDITGKMIYINNNLYTDQNGDKNLVLQANNILLNGIYIVTVSDGIQIKNLKLIAR